MLTTLITAPWSCPCCDSETCRVISDCRVGMARAQKALGRSVRVKSVPVGARPMAATPSVPQNRPTTMVRWSPRRRTTGPTTSPCTTMSSAPTAASSSPTCQGPQPYRSPA